MIINRMLKIKQVLLIGLLCSLGSSCINKTDDKKVDKLSPGLLINVDPDRDQTINLSEVVSDWKIIPLTSSPEALLGYPRKVVDFEGKLFFYDPSVTKSVKVFDTLGNYINTIGAMGKSPDELISVNGFTVDIDKRHVILGDNGQYIKIYDFDVKLISTLGNRVI